MAKSHNGWRKLSGSTRRRIEKIIRQGDRVTRRSLAAWRRRQLEGGSHGP